MTALCRSCDGEFDANDFCPRCQHYASEQLPEKTLDQLLSERPDLRAYRDEVRARLWDVETVADPLKRRAA
jgi:hypothetical protein